MYPGFSECSFGGQYTYVGNDPLDKTDPSGLRCQGSAIDGTCTVDNVQETKGGNLVKLDAAKRQELKNATKGFAGKLAAALGVGKAGLSAKIDRLEASMTSAYRAAEKAGAGQVTIAGNASGTIGATTTTGGAVGATLRGFDLNVANYANTQTIGDSTGNVMASTSRSEAAITFFDGALSEGGHDQQVTTLHEALHGTVMTGWDSGAAQSEHRPAFNDAAEQLLQLGQP
jgi:hypothetical protein